MCNASKLLSNIIIYLLNNNYIYIINMPIRVLVDTIEYDDIEKIIEIYNLKKEKYDEPLERLDRCEGGFKIRLKDYDKLEGDDNSKIKQLRWQYRYLKPFPGHLGFELREEIILYGCLKIVLGPEKVVFEF